MTGETLERTPNLTRTGALLIGLAAAVALIALSVINLDAQGAYYDELHQAPAAFSYLGKHSPIFNYSFLGIPGIPALNMPYTGAIKSHIYGLYLRLISPHFTIHSWRLFGIVFLAMGIFVFYQIAGASLQLTTAGIFGALLLTDASIILTNRHDLGPVSLALCFRLVLIALWISIELAKPDDWKYVVAGFVTGIAIFEKLSSVVLLAPLCLLLIASKKRSRRAWAASALGLLVGSLPLVLTNAGSYLRGKGFLSLSAVGAGRVDRLGIVEYAYQYLALGQGDLSRQEILGEFAAPFWKHAEALLMITTLLIIVLAAVRIRRQDRLIAIAGMMVAAYAAVGILVYALPGQTFVHHWILGSPFQYGAIALALAALAVQAERGSRETAIYGVACRVVVIALMAVRIPNMAALEMALASGKTSDRFHPAFTRLAEIAAVRSKESAFIAADWGTGTQVYCLADGQEDLIYEAFWSVEPRQSVLEIVRTTKKNTLYTVVTGMAPQFQEASTSIHLTLTNLPGWQEAAAESELTNLSPLRVRKFVRQGQ